jgi:hypothetical protein
LGPCEIENEKLQGPGGIWGPGEKEKDARKKSCYQFLQNVSSQLALPISEEHAQVIITSLRIASFEKNTLWTFGSKFKKYRFWKEELFADDAPSIINLP